MPEGPREDNEMNVGETIRRFRMGRGLSVRALAAETGFSPSFISQVELGQAAPSIASLARIAAALGIAPGDLLDERTRLSGTVTGSSHHSSAFGHEERSALLSLVFTHAVDGMAFIDPHFIIRAVNDTYVAQVGIPACDMIGHALEDIFPGWTEQAKLIYEGVRATGEPFRSEAHPYIFQGERERGVTYWDVSISPVHGANGAFLGYLLAHRDVTERRKMEQERERTVEQLRKVNAQLVLSSIPLEGRAERAMIRAANLKSR
ncbi:MAG: PAS domain-containing protein [Chloroflexi bacterium]|nr:PAS domain-containing protein [Chloroflexota bacterium]